MTFSDTDDNDKDKDDGIDLDALTDPIEKPTATTLAKLSGLTPQQAVQLSEVWDEMETSRRLSIVNELAELAMDNVDLNFDLVYKRALQDENGFVRSAALRGLYEYEGRDLIATLTDLLRNDEETEVRREAAIFLGRYALAAELEQLRQDDSDRIREALMESAEDTEEDERVRSRAIEAVGAMSGEETDNLIESIYEEDSIWMKVGAVDAMGRSANDAWLPTILRELENPAPEMRHAAAFAAGEIGDEVAVEPLKRAAILDPDREVRLAAVHSLGEIGGQKARVALQNVLYEGHDDLREAVQEAMTELSFNENPLALDL